MAKDLVLVLAVVVYSLATFVQPQTLRSLAEQHHKYSGLALQPEDYNEAAFTKIADSEFDCITPGNQMKWDATEPQRGHFTLGEGEKIVSHGSSHGQKIRGHTLLWHSQLPSWVSSGNFNATTLRAILKAHIDGVAGHWKGKIYAWDVVNEIFNEDGTLRQSVFSKTLGESFVADAFKFAHEADPGAKLYINDYNVESVNPKSTGLLNLVKKLKGQGVPIHGIGSQTHLRVGHNFGDFQQNLARFATADVDVAITELDIAIKDPATAANLQQQAKDYHTVYAACMAVPRCVGITVWGLTDKHSWIPHAAPGWGAPLLWDGNYKEKPAFASVKQALEGK